jgi:hypothetical protein
MKTNRIMKSINLYRLLFCLAIVAITLSSCDTDGEETMSWKPGSGLHIVGPGEIVIGEEDDYQYYVDGFTIDETYTWTLDGTPITPIREGEFVVLEFDTEGEHLLEVSNGTLEGSMTIVVTAE